MAQGDREKDLPKEDIGREEDMAQKVADDDAAGAMAATVGDAAADAAGEDELVEAADILEE